MRSNHFCRACALLIVIALAGGCANLEVDVRMFDKSRYDAFKASEVQTAALIDVQKQVIERQSTAKSGRPTTRPTTDQATYSLLNDRINIALQAQTALRKTITEPVGMMGDIEASDQAVLGKKTDAVNALNDVKSALVISQDAVLQESKIATDAPVGKTDLFSIFGSADAFVKLDHASELLYLPKVFWGRRVNVVSGFGSYGNIDIAVTATPDQGYTMKAVRVDSAKLIATTASLTRQLVSTVAAIYGIPTPLSGGGEGATESYDPVKELAAAAAETAAARAQQANRKAAATAVLRVIAAQSADLKSDDAAKRKAAVDAVRKAFDANKAALATPVKPAPAAPVPAAPAA